MGLRISRQEVLDNVIRFKERVLQRENEPKRGGGSFAPQRVYKVLLNQKTGDMRFDQKIKVLGETIGKGGKGESAADFKRVQIIVRQGSGGNPSRFELKDEKEHSLNPKELDPKAWKVATETIDLLNRKAKEMGKEAREEPFVEEKILKDLSSLPLSSVEERIEDLPGWMGSLSRVDAEKMLKGKREGTYLLRKGDGLTFSIAFHLDQENGFEVRPYLLTVVEKEEKMSDVLLLETSDGWILYQDDPTLTDSTLYPAVSSPRFLLEKLSQVAKYPLF